jgi:hypothetical protein
MASRHADFTQAYENIEFLTQLSSGQMNQLLAEIPALQQAKERVWRRRYPFSNGLAVL